MLSECPSCKRPVLKGINPIVFSDDALNAMKDVRSKEILRLRAKGTTLQAIAESYGISRERVRQLEAKGLRRLRRNRRPIACYLCAPDPESPAQVSDDVPRKELADTRRGAVTRLRPEAPFAEIRQDPLLAHAYLPWSESEDVAVIRRHRQGRTVDEMAHAHRRTPGAIVARLAKLGYLESQHVPSPARE